MKKDTPNFVASHDTCQQAKGETMMSLGCFQRLPTPIHIWRRICMDFNVNLFKVGNKLVIMGAVVFFYQAFPLLSLTTKIYTLTHGENLNG